MGETFFTSDTHFHHKRMLDFRTEFVDIEDMNEKLIARWNAKIGKNDFVYFLGDFSFGRTKDIIETMNRLNGKIHYIIGNHDKYIVKKSEIQKRLEWVKDYYKLKIYNEEIVLCHYCFHIWNKHHYGSWHLYGHSHGNIEDNSNRKRIDVGVDTNNFYPYSFEDIKKIMDERTFVGLDHHIQK